MMLTLLVGARPVQTDWKMKKSTFFAFAGLNNLRYFLYVQ
jgi:hypothetical protein